MSRVWVISPSSVRWRFWRATAPSRVIISSAASPVTGSWVSVLFLQTFILPSLGFRISLSLNYFKRILPRHSRRLYLHLQRLRSCTPLQQLPRDRRPLPPALKRTRARPIRSPSPHFYLQTDSRTRAPLWTRRSHDRRPIRQQLPVTSERTDVTHNPLLRVLNREKTVKGAVLEMQWLNPCFFVCVFRTTRRTRLHFLACLWL